jgi:hypothetical protein
LDNNNRRKYERVVTKDLFVAVENKKDLSYASIDFNRYGIGIITELDFSIDDELNLTIFNDENFLIDNVFGVIKNKNKLNGTGKYRYGLQFTIRKISHKNKSLLTDLEKSLKNKR